MGYNNQIVISASAQITRTKERKAESAVGMTDAQIEESLAAAAQNALLTSATSTLEGTGDRVEITVVVTKEVTDGSS